MRIVNDFFDKWCCYCRGGVSIPKVSCPVLTWRDSCSVMTFKKKKKEICLKAVVLQPLPRSAVCKESYVAFICLFVDIIACLLCLVNGWPHSVFKSHVQILLETRAQGWKQHFRVMQQPNAAIRIQKYEMYKLKSQSNRTGCVMQIHTVSVWNMGLW